MKFNIERALTLEESARKGDIRAIKSVEVVDDQTAKLILSEPFAPLLAQLADRAGMMMSPTAIKAVDTATFANAPVCSGPYKFKERVVQDHVTRRAVRRLLEQGRGPFRRDRLPADAAIPPCG